MPKWLSATVLVLLLFVLNVMTVKYFGEAGFWFTLIKLVTAGALPIVAASLLFPGFVSEAKYHAIVEDLWNNSGLFPDDFPGFLAGFQIAFFAFVSLEVADTAAAETRSPERNLSKTINAIPVRLTLFYVLALATIYAVIPRHAVVPSESPFTTVF